MLVSTIYIGKAPKSTDDNYLNYVYITEVSVTSQEISVDCTINSIKDGWCLACYFFDVFF